MNTETITPPGAGHMGTEPLHPGTHQAAGMIAGNLIQQKSGMDEQNPLAVLTNYETEIDTLLSKPEVLPGMHTKFLQTELTSFVKAGLAAHEVHKLSDEELARVGSKGLRFLSEVSDQAFAAPKDLRIPGEFQGFEETIKPLVTLFDRLDAVQAPTVKQAVARTLVLLRFSSQERDGIHERFVEKYINQLIEEENSSPIIENRRPAAYLGRLTLRVKKNRGSHKIAEKDDSKNDASEINKVWQSPDFLACFGSRIKKNRQKYKISFSGWPRKERKLFNRAIEAFGFSQEETTDLFGAWNSFDEGKDIQDKHKGRVRNMLKAWQVISALMTAGPDVPHEVYRKFNIRNFGRYRARTLYDQLEYFKQAGQQEHVEPAAKPLVIGATSDWNGSLSRPEKRFGAVEPIYMEATSLAEVARAIIKTKKVALISSLIVNAHGNKDMIELGDDSPEVTTAQMLQSKALTRLQHKGIFTPNADIVLIACSTGKQGGIAEVISKQSGMNVIGPSDGSYGSIRRSLRRPDEYEVVFRRPRSRPGLLGKLGLSGTDKVAAVSYRRGKADHSKSVNLND